MLKRIAPDKWRHFFAGIIMGAFLQASVWWLWPARPGLMALAVFIIVVVVSYGFELFSKVTGKGHYDFIDAVATIIGGVIGMATVLGILLGLS